MAKISVSLPDDLKAQLSAYAKAHGQGVSDVIQDALRSHLNAGHPAPQPPPPQTQPQPQPLPVPDQQLTDRVKQLESYVALIAYQSEHMRQGVAQTAAAFKHNWGQLIPCPQAIIEPPWPHTPPPGWGTPYQVKYLP